MKRNVIKIVTTMVFALLLGIVNIMPVQAAEGSVSFGSGSYNVSQGESFNIGVHVKGSESIAAYEFYMDYNSDSLEYVSGADGGGSGRLKFLGDGNESSYSYMLTFKAKNPGTSNISISGVYLGPTNPNSGTDMTITSAGSTSVTISGPQSSSGNADLSALSLSPIGGFNFSKEKTEYDITVDNDVDKIAVTATPADSKATVVISDTNINVGVNTITIKVTAESGTVKNYKIIVRRKDAPQATSSTTPTTVQEIEETEVAFNINGRDMYFTKDIKGVELPEGFEETKIEYKGRNISTLTNQLNNITLIYLVDGLGKDGAFFVFDEKSDTAYSYTSLENKVHEYVMLKFDESLQLPKGYTTSTLSLNELGIADDETPLKILVAEIESDFFLFYGMNIQGDIGFYQYDTKEGTVQRYTGTTPTSTTGVPESETEVESPDSVTAMEQQLTELKYENQKDLRNKLVIIMILAFTCLLLIIIVISLILKLKNKDDDEIEDDEEKLPYFPVNVKADVEETLKDNKEEPVNETHTATGDTVEFSVNVDEFLKNQLPAPGEEEKQDENLFSGLDNHKEVNEEEETDFFLDFDDDDFTFFDLDDEDDNL